MEQVQTVSDNAMQRLSKADRDLQAVVTIAPLTKAGIRVHHSGLLPVVKELTELLIQEHHIKVWSQTNQFNTTVLLLLQKTALTTLTMIFARRCLCLIRFANESCKGMAQLQFTRQGEAVSRRIARSILGFIYVAHLWY